PLVTDLGGEIVGPVVGRDEPAGLGAADGHADVVAGREVVDARLHLPGEPAGVAAATGARDRCEWRAGRVADLGAGDIPRPALARATYRGDVRIQRDVVLAGRIAEAAVGQAGGHPCHGDHAPVHWAEPFAVLQPQEHRGATAA